MSKWVHRTAALLGAVLFLFTSLGLTGLVLWQMHQQSRQNAATKGIQQALDQAKKQQTPKEGKLEGTKLTGFTPVDKVDKLQIIDTTTGAGAAVKASDTVTAHYTGALAKDGTIFQSSLDSGQPFTSAISGLIKGWQEGIPGMKVGGTRRLIIPAAEAYGAQSPAANIPANSDLVFDIQLIKIN